jgi:DNA gyrase subunit B/topoisomerase-4 subunit B
MDRPCGADHPMGVIIGDKRETDRVVKDLLGKDASARYRFVMERAGEADDVDI